MAVEDISDEIEIFMKETLDIQKFDILIIEGWKNRSLKVSKIVKTSLEKVVEDAKKAGKYNTETVSEVKTTRLGMNALKGSDLEDEMVDVETGEVIKIEHTEEIPDGLSEEDNDDNKTEPQGDNDQARDNASDINDEKNEDTPDR